MKTKSIIIDEKDWFNIDEVVDPKLKLCEGEELTRLRSDFVHNSLGLYIKVQEYLKKRRSLSKRQHIKIDEVDLDFYPYYLEWLEGCRKEYE